jgi:nucleotide-binding universal stress UspA family protein
VRILLAVDGSEASQAAVEAVKMRTWPEGSVVRVLSVAQPVFPPPPPPAASSLFYGPGPYPPEVNVSMEMAERSAETAAQELVARTARELAPTGCATEAVTDRGDPRDVIVDQSNEWPADLIVLGSHGRTGLKRWVLGSVAESVVRHAPCSVEVARPAHQSPV